MIASKSTAGSELGARHELVTAGRSAGDIRLDLADPASHGPALAQAGPLDAVVSAAGNVHFGALAEMTDELWGIGLRDKLMGQVNLALAAAKVLKDTPVVALCACRNMWHGGWIKLKARLDASASSDIANTPLSSVSSAISRKSMNDRPVAGGKSTPWHFTVSATYRAAMTPSTAFSTRSDSHPAATRSSCSATWSIAGPIRSACCAD